MASPCRSPASAKSSASRSPAAAAAREPAPPPDALPLTSRGHLPIPRLQPRTSPLVAHLNPLDWLLAALLAYSVVRAALNGFLRAAFNLAGLVLGLPLAFWGYADLAFDLRNLLTSPALAQLVAFVLILSAVALVASLLGRLFRRGARTVGLGFADRLGGAAFGFVRGLLIGAAILLAITAFLPTAPWVQRSQLAPYFLRGAHALSFSMPADLRLRLRDGLDRLKSAGFGKMGSPGWLEGEFPPNLIPGGSRESSVTARKR